MNMKTRIFDARPVEREVLTTKQYLQLKPADRKHIAETKIVPPKLGSKSFGGIAVTYKTPIFKVG